MYMYITYKHILVLLHIIMSIINLHIPTPTLSKSITDLPPQLVITSDGLTQAPVTSRYIVSSGLQGTIASSLTQLNMLVYLYRGEVVLEDGAPVATKHGIEY